MNFRIMMLAGLLAGLCVIAACGGNSETGAAPTAPRPSDGNTIGRGPVPPAPPPLPPTSSTCDASKVQWTIGEKASDDLLERARVAAGAASARFVRPNQPITMEFLPSRLTLGLDKRDVVSLATCG